MYYQFSRIVILILVAIAAKACLFAADANRIQPYSKNPWYWQFQGDPTLLIGGSDNDNCFQWEPDRLVAHLDKLKAVGGNFIRNTLSTRDEGNAYPFRQLNGRYEFSLWNETFWSKLDFYLSETAKRGIVIQLTLWDQHDFTASSWESQFWNPKNNNVGLEASRIYDDHAFFSTVKERNALMLPYQQKFVSKVLDHSLMYDHVLYNITNEGWAGLEWETYWAKFIREKAALAGKTIEVTTMEHSSDLSVEAALEYPELFSYFEISQINNYSTGYRGAEFNQRIQLWRKQISNSLGPRPLVSEKIYGGPRGNPSMGNADDALDRYWRLVFSGCSALRFHRPNSGIGLSEGAQKQIASLRSFANEYDLFHSHSAPGAIELADAPESYCLKNDKGSFAVYSPTGSSCKLKVSKKEYSLRFLIADKGEWTEAVRVSPENGYINIEAKTGSPLLCIAKPVR